MTFPVRTDGRNEHGTQGGTLPNITYSFPAVRAEVLYRSEALADSREPSPSPRIDHKLARGFGMRREESAPAPVVPPATGRHPLAAPEAQPPLHVCFGNPHTLFPAVLREGHDIRHAGSMA